MKEITCFVANDIITVYVVLEINKDGETDEELSEAVCVFSSKEKAEKYKSEHEHLPWTRYEIKKMKVE